MTEKIIASLTHLPVKVKHAFSPEPFCVTGKIPTVTVSGETTAEKMLIDGEERDIFKRVVTLNVYTQKEFGAKKGEEVVKLILPSLLPLSKTVKVDTPQYIPKLLHFVTRVTLTFLKTEE